VFTAQYGLIAYIKQITFSFKRLVTLHVTYSFPWGWSYLTETCLKVFVSGTFLVLLLCVWWILLIFIVICYLIHGEPGSSVGIVTGYGRFGDRIPVRPRFFTHVQTDPGVQPASCTMGTGCFPGVNWSGHGVDQPSSQCQGWEWVELYLYSPSRPLVSCYRVTFTS
jgi:hypothetical protein